MNSSQRDIFQLNGHTSTKQIKALVYIKSWVSLLVILLHVDFLLSREDFQLLPAPAERADAIFPIKFITLPYKRK